MQFALAYLAHTCAPLYNHVLKSRFDFIVRTMQTYGPSTCNHITHIFIMLSYDMIWWWWGKWWQYGKNSKFTHDWWQEFKIFDSIYIIRFFSTRVCSSYFSLFFLFIHCCFANINHPSSEIVCRNIETMILFHEPTMLKRLNDSSVQIIFTI